MHLPCYRNGVTEPNLRLIIKRLLPSLPLCPFPETRCGVETAGGNGENLCCVFPFNYRGIDYFTCTAADSEEPWCSITRNYDRDGLWGNCVGKCLTKS